MDYEPAVVSDILDFMFKPNFGLNLDILKVEVGASCPKTASWCCDAHSYCRRANPGRAIAAVRALARSLCAAAGRKSAPEIGLKNEFRRR